MNLWDINPTFAGEALSVREHKGYQIFTVGEGDAAQTIAFPPSVTPSPHAAALRLAQIFPNMADAIHLDTRRFMGLSR